MILWTPTLAAITPSIPQQCDSYSDTYISQICTLSPSLSNLDTTNFSRDKVQLSTSAPQSYLYQHLIAKTLLQRLSMIVWVNFCMCVLAMCILPWYLRSSSSFSTLGKAKLQSNHTLCNYPNVYALSCKHLLSQCSSLHSDTSVLPVPWVRIQFRSCLLYEVFHQTLSANSHSPLGLPSYPVHAPVYHMLLFTVLNCF